MKKIIALIFLFVSVTASAQYTLRLGPYGPYVPPPLRLEVSKELPLRAIAEQPNISVMGTGWWLGSDRTPKAPVWTVNGIVNGNNLVGQIIMNDEYQITFKAPLHKPVKNPVEVIASYGDLHLNGKIFDTSITCHIEIAESPDTSSSFENNGGKKDINDQEKDVDDKSSRYEVKMLSLIKAGTKKVWGGIKIVRDEGSFIVRLKKDKAEVINIINNLEVMTDDCRNILLNPTTCTGLLHVAGTSQIKVTAANPPGQPYPIVEIWFVPYPIEFSRVSFDCPPPQGSGDKGHSIGVQPMMKVGRTLPFDIKFIAKDGEQIIIESPEDSDDGYLKIWVRKIKDD